MKNNMMNKFVNHSVRIFQGHDPNTELKETGILLNNTHFLDQFSTAQMSSVEIFGLSASQFISSEVNNLSSAVSFSDNTQGGNSLGLPAVNYAQAIDMSGSGHGFAPQSGLSGGSISPEALDTYSSAQGSSSPDSNVANRSFRTVQSGSGGGQESSNAALTTNSNSEDPQLQSPTVSVNGSITNEGDPIPLSISVTTDPQPGVITIVTITGVPDDATLSAGTRNANGT